MPSERRIEAGRINGAKARGTKTPQGLARSAANAITHGLRARTTVLMNESEEEFQKLRDDYLSELGPQSRIETDLVDQLVVARWRLERIWMIETGLLDLEMTKQREEVEKNFEAIDEEIRTALAFRSLCDDSHTLSLLNRYEARFQRVSASVLEALHLLRENQNLPSEGNDAEVL